MFKVSNRYTRKRCLLISKITLKISERRHLTTSYFSGSNCPETCLGQFFLEYISIWNQVPRPVISTIVEPYMLWEIRNHYRNIWFMKNSECQHFLFLKNSPKNSQSFQLFTLYSKGRHFSITKLDILIFCNILHLEIDFWNLSSKRTVSLWTFWQKCREKYYKWDIEKNGIAYSIARNLKTAYLWNFHFR